MIETYFAKGFRSSFRSSSKISSKKSISSKTKTSTSSRKKTATSSKSSSKVKTKTPTGKSTAKPGSKVKTANGKTVQSSAKKPTNKQYSKSQGVVGDHSYSPHFTNGYNPPVGSVVYYRDHDALDYLPWIYIFSQSSPRNDQATIVQPDNKQVKAQPERGGVDGMLIFNWIILVIVGAAIIAGIVYMVNKFTKKGA